MAVFAGTLKFTEDALQHINIPIIAQLQLGKMNNMSAEQRPIAEQKSEVQLSETYQYNAAADFVLVTNNNTPQDIIEEWKEVAEGFGTSMSLWNTSLYSGLSYTQKRKTDGRSLIDDMQGKVVIILNHADKDHKTYPTEYLDSMEILQAAKTANISTYVIGSHFDIKKSTLPVDPSHISVVVVTHDYLTKPNKKDLAKEVAKREKELKQQNPDKRYVSYDDFNPKKTNMPHSLFKKNWQVGTWRYAEAADKKRAHIAFRQVDKIESADHEDLYHFVKLLPFSKKLTYLGRKCHEVCKEAIIKAVLSDLVDELSIAREEKWQDKHKPFNLQYLKEFSKGTYADKESLLRVIVQYEYLVSRVKSCYDVNSHLHRRKKLQKECEPYILDVLLQFKYEQCHLLRTSLQNLSAKVRRKNLFESYSNPYGRKTEIDSHLSLDGDKLASGIATYSAKQSAFNDVGNDYDTEEQLRAKTKSSQGSLRF
jgi:calcineurin-like phosphoesterase family protein